MQAEDSALARGDLMLGIGCQRGVSAELLERGIRHILDRHRLQVASVRAVATIEHKREEPGLLALCQRHHWPLTFYTPDQLTHASVENSSAAEQHVGAPAVAEPAALLLSGARELLVHKTPYSEHGVPGSMTLAVARGGSPGHD